MIATMAFAFVACDLFYQPTACTVCGSSDCICGESYNIITLPVELEIIVRNDFYSEFGTKLRLGGDDKVYGNFYGVVVLFIEGHGRAVTMVEAADIEFWWGSIFQLKVWHNGSFYNIADAYEAGILSAVNVESAWQVHVARGWGQKQHTYSECGQNILGFDAQYFRTDFATQHNEVVVIRNNRQLQDYISSYANNLNWMRDYIDYLKSDLSTTFFAGRYLIIIRQTGSGSCSFAINRITAQGIIYIDQIHGITDDNGGWSIVIEMPNSFNPQTLTVRNLGQEHFALTVQGGYIFTCEYEFNAWNWADMPVARPPSTVQAQAGEQVFIISTIHPPGAFFYAWLDGNNHITSQRDFVFTMQHRDVALRQRVGNSKDIIGQFKEWAIEDYSAKFLNYDDLDITYFYGHFLRQVASFHTDISIAVMFNNPADTALGSEEIVTAQRRITISYTDGNRILIWRMGRFYRLQEAYNASYLSANDILEIRRIHHARLNMYDEVWSLWGDMAGALEAEGFTITFVHTIFTGGGGFRAERGEDEFLHITVHIIDQSNPQDGWFFTTTDHGMNWPMFIYAVRQMDIFSPSSISAHGTSSAVRIAYTAIGGITAFPHLNFESQYLGVSSLFLGEQNVFNVRNVNQLEEYLALSVGAVMDWNLGMTMTYEQFQRGQFNEQFFEENQIVIVRLTEGSRGNRNRVNSVKKCGTIILEQYQRGVDTAIGSLSIVIVLCRTVEPANGFNLVRVGLSV